MSLDGVAQILQIIQADIYRIDGPNLQKKSFIGSRSHEWGKFIHETKGPLIFLINLKI